MSAFADRMRAVAADDGVDAVGEALMVEAAGEDAWRWPPKFHEPAEALAGALPNARTVLVEGGHIIDPASPQVIAFIEEVAGTG